jgi:hypothetical protein
LRLRSDLRLLKKTWPKTNTNGACVPGEIGMAQSIIVVAYARLARNMNIPTNRGQDFAAITESAGNAETRRTLERSTNSATKMFVTTNVEFVAALGAIMESASNVYVRM